MGHHAAINLVGLRLPNPSPEGRRARCPPPPGCPEGYSSPSAALPVGWSLCPSCSPPGCGRISPRCSPEETSPAQADLHPILAFLTKAMCSVCACNRSRTKLQDRWPKSMILPRPTCLTSSMEILHVAILVNTQLLQNIKKEKSCCLIVFVSESMR